LKTFRFAAAKPPRHPGNCHGFARIIESQLAWPVRGEDKVASLRRDRAHQRRERERWRRVLREVDPEESLIAFRPDDAGMTARAGFARRGRLPRDAIGRAGREEILDFRRRIFGDERPVGLRAQMQQGKRRLLRLDVRREAVRPQLAVRAARDGI
jgi:hypothetical protein